MSNLTSNKKIEKTRSSIGWTLNLSMLKTLFFAFLIIDLIFVLTISIMHLYSIESRIQPIITTLDVDMILPHEDPPWMITMASPTEGSRWADFLFQDSALQSYQVRRSIRVPSLFAILGESRWTDANYSIIVAAGTGYVRISYDLNSDLELFSAAFRWIMMIQALLIAVYLFKHSQKVRTTLKPLSDLATSTKTLQKNVTTLSSTTDPNQLKSIAGALEKIDLHQLDKQVFVQTNQEELQEITSAINDMLLRINQAVQSQTRFVSDASHELRTPIAVIQGYINLLDRWGKNDPITLQESIDAIKNETENMKTLVEHLLFLARGDNETIQLQLDTFNVAGLIDEIIKEMRFIDPDRPFHFDQADPIMMCADRQLLKQTLRILIDNSMKYSDPHDPIIIGCHNKDDKTKIVIQDQGIGIKAEDVSRIFDRFYRSDPARKVKVKGAGLGLAIAKWIIEKHEGQLEVLSREKIGTRVTLQLPNRLSTVEKSGT